MIRRPPRSTQSRSSAASDVYKRQIVVDDDIDVSNLEELMWAVCSRSDPATSIDFIRNAWSTPLDPSIPPERKAKGDFTNSRAIIDACRPFHWKDQYPICLLYTSDAADDLLCVDLGGRRIIKKKKKLNRKKAS